MPPATVRTARQYKVMKITAESSNYFAFLVDPLVDSPPTFVAVLEIYEVNGQTPRNTHQYATEMFYFLKGEGIAFCDGKESPIKAGDTLIIPPRSEHIVKNTGSGKIYALTVMNPNEGFAELIHSGIPHQLDEEDLEVLERLGRS
jgi:mannose-6-phosphate isomerase-like protein (cupin superfamily)